MSASLLFWQFKEIWHITEYSNKLWQTLWKVSCHYLAWQFQSQVWKRLQRVVSSALIILSTVLLIIKSIYIRHCLKKAESIIKDAHHLTHTLFSLQWSEKGIETWSYTTRFRISIPLRSLGSWTNLPNPNLNLATEYERQPLVLSWTCFSNCCLH